MPSAITMIDGTMRIFQADFSDLVDRLQSGANVLMLQEAAGRPVAVPVSAVLAIRPQDVRADWLLEEAGTTLASSDARVGGPEWASA
jgi:hypothetical protein